MKKNDAVFAGKSTSFPFQYLVDLLAFVEAHRDIIEIITYSDLSWGKDYEYKNHYREEMKSWKSELKAGTRDRDKIYLLIQHDVDRLPKRTDDILKEEEKLGIPSNVMIFNKRTNRRHYQKTGELVYEDYDLDVEYLRRLQDEAGFVVGYHSNAYERALFDNVEAERIFEEDIRELRKLYDIRFFAPHGGARNPAGLTNNSMELPASLRDSMRWVNNRHTAHFDGNYSDGGINNTKTRNPRRRDIRDYIRRWKRGRRYRILLHPQYYSEPWMVSESLKGTAWYDEMVNCYLSGEGKTFWRDLSLG